MQDNGVFARERGRLFGLAYRLLGSVSDAEDVLQDVHLAWLQQDQSQIANPAGWLVTVATRHCLDQLRSARRQREQYVGVWLPEPLLEATAATAPNPQDTLELARNLSLAFVHMLERLTPPERAVFILRQAFDWPYQDIAGVVDRSEMHCRQLHKRAREKLDGEQAPHASFNDAQPLLTHFLHTCLSGNYDALLQQLHTDLAAYSDGGGKVLALLRPIHGRERVARFLLRLIQPRAGLWVEPRCINGDPGLLVFERGQVTAALAFCFRDGQLWRLYSIRNPDKLRHLQPQPDVQHPART